MTDYTGMHAGLPHDPLFGVAPSPLALILAEMHLCHKRGQTEAAVELARIAAPYIHPRPRASTSPDDLAHMTDEELENLPTID